MLTVITVYFFVLAFFGLVNLSGYAKRGESGIAVGAALFLVFDLYCGYFLLTHH